MLVTNIILMVSLKQEDYLSGGSMESVVFILDGVHIAVCTLAIMNVLFVDGFYNIRMNKKESLKEKLPVFLDTDRALPQTQSERART